MSGNPDGFDKLLNQIFKNPQRSRQDLNIDIPRHGQNFWGRFLHFSTLIHPRNLFCSSKELEKSIDIITRVRLGNDLAEYSDDEIWRAKNVYDIHFHGDTGEKLNYVGGLPARVPVNAILTSCILTYRKTLGANIFWQSANQAFNSLVNHTYRNGTTESDNSATYFCLTQFAATFSGVIACVGVTDFLRNSKPVIRKLSPLFALTSAHLVSVPIVRFKELQTGIEVSKVDGKSLGLSKVAANMAILQTIISRICTVAPVFLLTPIFMKRLQRLKSLQMYPPVHILTQSLVCGVIFYVSTPLGLALFAQPFPIRLNRLEMNLQDRAKKMVSLEEVVYFNKGL